MRSDLNRVRMAIAIRTRKENTNHDSVCYLPHVYTGVSTTPVELEDDVIIRLGELSQITFPLASFLMNLN